MWSRNSPSAQLRREVVKERLVNAIQPLLTSAGFSAVNADVSYRSVAQRVDVLSFEFFPTEKLAKWGLPRNSFSLEAGCFFKFLPPIFGSVDGSEPRHLRPAMCHVRLSPSRTLWQLRARHSPNVWAVHEAGKNLDRCVGDAVKVVESKVIPWFLRFDELRELERTLISDDEDMQRGWGFGAKASPVRALLLGLVAAKLGHADVARPNLLLASRSPGLNELAGNDRPLNAALSALSALSR